MRRFEGYEHGINLGGWLSQCDHSKERYENFIHEDDLARIAGWGLDHVRVPIDYELVETKEGDYIEAGFDIIDKVYAWCDKYNLNMILDLHKTFGYSFDFGENEAGFFDNEAYQERFYKLWEKIASRYGKNHSRMAFELLNEVTDKEYCDTWNRIIVNCIQRVRVFAPDTYIIIGGYYNNSIEALPDLVRPDDEKVVYTFHCYEPLIFTHQGAHWAPGMDVNFRMPLSTTYKEMGELSKKYLSQVTVGFEGFDQNSVLTSEFFDKYFAHAVAVAEERNVPLYCGEYGVINLANAKDTYQWYKLIADSFDRFRIGRSAWSYKEMDFGIIDAHMDEVRDDLLKRL